MMRGALKWVKAVAMLGKTNMEARTSNITSKNLVSFLQTLLKAYDDSLNENNILKFALEAVWDYYKRHCNQVFPWQTTICSYVCMEKSHYASWIAFNRPYRLLRHD